MDIDAYLEALGTDIQRISDRLQAVEGRADEVRHDVGTEIAEIANLVETGLASTNATIREMGSESIQRLKIVDTKHDSLGHALGVRFDSRLSIVEEVLGSVEGRVNAELKSVDEILENQTGRIDGLLTSVSKNIEDGAIKAERAHEQTKSTWASMHADAERRMDERLADMDGRLRGSAVDDAGGMRTRISNLESEIRALRSRQEDFEQESKGKTAQLSQATGDLTTSQATLGEKLQATGDSLKRSLEQATGRQSEQAGRLQKLEADQRQLTQNLLTSLSDMKRDIGGSAQVQTQSIERLDSRMKEAEEVARESHMQMVTKLQAHATSCDGAICTAVREIGTKMMHEVTSLEARMKRSGEENVRLIKRLHTEEAHKSATIMREELAANSSKLLATTSRGQVNPEREHPVEGELSRLRGRVENLEMSNRSSTDATSRLEDRCASVESAVTAKVLETEAMQNSRTKMILQEVGRFNDQVSRLVINIDNKIETNIESGREQLAVAEKRIQERFTSDMDQLAARLKSASKDDFGEQLNHMQSKVAEELKGAKEIQRLAAERQDEKIRKIENETLEEMARGNELLQADLAAKLAEHSETTKSGLANITADLAQGLDQCQQRATAVEEAASSKLNTELLDLRGDLARKYASLEGKLVTGLEEFSTIMDGKADVAYLKTCDSLVRDEVALVGEACKELSAALDEQVAAVDKMESLTEQLDADVSEVATDISLMDATLASCFSEVTTLQGAVGSLELTLKHSAKSLLQTSRSDLSTLRREMCTGFRDLKSELSSEVDGRVAKVENSIDRRILVLTEKANESVTKSELRTQLALIRMSCDESNIAIQALDQQIANIEEDSGLSARVDDLSDAITDLSIETAIISATGAISPPVPGF